MNKAALPTTAWRKSSYSTATGNCVEVTSTTDSVFVRHSKNPTAGTITFSFPAWMSFIREVRAGGVSANGSATVSMIGTDTLVRSLHTNTELRFDQDEWAAFIAGATDGEFDFTRHLAAANRHVPQIDRCEAWRSAPTPQATARSETARFSTDSNEPTRYSIATYALTGASA